MTLPPFTPIDPRRRRVPPPDPSARRRLPMIRARSPFPPEIDAQIAAQRRAARPVTVREPLTPFIVLRRSADDAGARPAKGGDERFSTWFEDVKAPGIRCFTPQQGVRYRFHITVTNLGAAPVLMGMVELYGGTSPQYPDARTLFAMAPFTCPAAQSSEVTLELVVPTAIVQGCNYLMVQAIDLLQDRTKGGTDLSQDRHVSWIHVNKV